MGNQNRDQLRELFAIKPPEPTKPVPPPGPGETLPIIRLADFDLTNVADDQDDHPEFSQTSGYTFGYGEQLKSEESIGESGGIEGEDKQLGNPELARIKVRNGEVIDNKYRILNALGAGGASEVYLCERMLVGDRVAIKLLRANFGVDPD